MKRIFFALRLLILLLCAATQIALPQSKEPFSINRSPLPVPTGPVMDYAGVLSPDSKKRIEKKIIEFRNTTNPSVELAVAIVKTTGERPIFDYSIAVARGWGIGSRDSDNPSALLFIAIDDRKYFTQVSEDLEDELPDGLVGSLQRLHLVPQFKQANYSQGIEDTIDAYIRTIKVKSDGLPASATPSADTGETNSGTGGSDTGESIRSICEVVGCLFVILIIVLIAANSSDNKNKPNKRDRDRWGGGGGDSGGSGAGSVIVASILAGLISGAMSGGSSGSSGSWGGGNSSWGSGSGGAWGGFGGGGDFGGGGAGGNW